MNDRTTDDGAGDREAFVALLGSVRSHVDAALGAWLDPKVEGAAAESSAAGAAARSIQRLALRGGKRMRAALVGAGYVACRDAGESAAASPWLDVERAMVAVELLQVYLLVHDDWMDDDDMRRGGPSVHAELREIYGSKRLGDAFGVLAGDLAAGYAQEALAEATLLASIPADRVVRAMRAFARMQEEVVLGQLAEMHAAAAPKDAAPVERVYALKTASYTATGPVTIGALLAGARDERIAQLESFGAKLGVAFQLRDDILGVFGDPASTGKPAWSDLRQRKRTALVEELRRSPEGREVLARASTASAADMDDVALAAVAKAMETTGARARVEERIGVLAEEAADALAKADVPGVLGKRWLSGAIAALTERTS